MQSKSQHPASTVVLSLGTREFSGKRSSGKPRPSAVHFNIGNQFQTIWGETDLGGTESELFWCIGAALSPGVCALASLSIYLITSSSFESSMHAIISRTRIATRPFLHQIIAQNLQWLSDKAEFLTGLFREAIESYTRGDCIHMLIFTGTRGIKYRRSNRASLLSLLIITSVPLPAVQDPLPSNPRLFRRCGSRTGL